MPVIIGIWSLYFCVLPLKTLWSLSLYWNCSFARTALEQLPGQPQMSETAHPLHQGWWWMWPGPKGRQWKGKLFEVPHVGMRWAVFQRGNCLSLPSLTAASAVLLKCLNCFDLGLDWQKIGFHFKGRLQVPAFPRDWKTKKAKNEGLIGRKRKSCLEKSQGAF